MDLRIKETPSAFIIAFAFSNPPISSPTDTIHLIRALQKFGVSQAECQELPREAKLTDSKNRTSQDGVVRIRLIFHGESYRQDSFTVLHIVYMSREHPKVCVKTGTRDDRRN